MEALFRFEEPGRLGYREVRMRHTDEEERLHLVIHVHGPARRGDFPYRATFHNTQHNEIGTTRDAAVEALKTRLARLGYTREQLAAMEVLPPLPK